MDVTKSNDQKKPHSQNKSEKVSRNCEIVLKRDPRVIEQYSAWITITFQNTRFKQIANPFLLKFSHFTNLTASMHDYYYYFSHKYSI